MELNFDVNNIMQQDVESLGKSLEFLASNENTTDLLKSLHPLQLINFFKKVFDIFSTKNKREFANAENIFNQIIDVIDPWLTPNMSEVLCDVIKNPVRSQKEYAYLAFISLIKKNPQQIKICMPTLIHKFVSDLGDANKNIRNNVVLTLEAILACSGNSDLDSFIPVVLNGLQNPTSIYDCVEALASCVFVQNVEAPALAVTVPVMIRGLKDKKTATNRLACVIIDNMCKLIEHPKEILPFYSVLKSQLDRAADSISDPEARSVSQRALNTLKGACSGQEDAVFTKTVNDFVTLFNNDEILPADSELLSNLLTNMCNSHYFDKDSWYSLMQKYNLDN